MGWTNFGTEILAQGSLYHTPEGGIAQRYINKTGGASVKGTCVTSGSVTGGVIAVPVDAPNCIGVIYNSGAADGEYVWVVTSGIAEVLFWNAPTLGYLARTGLTSDTGEVAGKALSEDIPTSPFASDKHFCEIGHILETKAEAGLAKVNLHFN